MSLTLINGNMGYLSRAIAQAEPDRTAVVDYFGGTRRVLTYGDMETRLEKTAHALAGLGLKPGERLAVGIGNRCDFIQVMFGAMRAGIVAVPLNNRLGAEQLGYIIDNAGCRGAVFDPAAGPGIAPAILAADLAVRAAVEPVDGAVDFTAAVEAADAQFDPVPLDDGHIAMLPYTSGSTGRPKGVCLTHAGSHWFLEAMPRMMAPEFHDGPSVLVAVPLFHKNAMIGGVKLMFRMGGSVVILPGFEPRQFLDVLARERCNITTGVPAMYTLLLQEAELIERLDFSHFKKAFIGSAPTTPDLLCEIEARFGCRIHQGYGLTEGGPVVFTQPDPGSAWTGGRAPMESCGVPLPGGSVRLVGADGAICDSFGELWVRNPGMATGYHALPRVNAERFVDGWLKTGDLFEKDADGFFFFRGRTDDMFHCGGENVYPLEVESVLRSHPDVLDVAVVPLTHAVKGQVPGAMVVLRPGASGDETAMRAFYLERGPAYAHPRHIVFVDRLPLTGVGKIDRKTVTQSLMGSFTA